jgi:hypothetical protein
MFDDGIGSLPPRHPLEKIFHYFRAIPLVPRAVLAFVFPFIFVDFWNYYSAGTALLLSAPILALLYAGCGALAAKFASDQSDTRFAYTGAAAGALLWLASTLVNTAIGLVIGTASLGATLLLGVPYLCFCAPGNLILGALAGALGGAIFSWFHRNNPSNF